MKDTSSEDKAVQPRREYSESFKRMVVREYERGFLNKDQLQRKYGIGGNSRVLYWCRRYGRLHYPVPGDRGGLPVKDPQKRRIRDLERQLEDARLKVAAYEKLISIAEREEGISILKKGAAKPSQSSRKNTPGR